MVFADMKTCRKALLVNVPKATMLTTEPVENQVTEPALVEAVKRYDLEAFGSRVERHLDHIHAFISVKLTVLHLADEISMSERSPISRPVPLSPCRFPREREATRRIQCWS